MAVLTFRNHQMSDVIALFVGVDFRWGISQALPGYQISAHGRVILAHVRRTTWHEWCSHLPPWDHSDTELSGPSDSHVPSPHGKHLSTQNKCNHLCNFFLKLWCQFVKQFHCDIRAHCCFGMLSGNFPKNFTLKSTEWRTHLPKCVWIYIIGKANQNNLVRVFIKPFIYAGKHIYLQITHTTLCMYYGI